MNLLNVDAFLQPIVIGLVIVLAVEPDVLRATRGALAGARGGAVMTAAAGGERRHEALRGGVALDNVDLLSMTGRCSPCSATTGPASRR